MSVVSYLGFGVVALRCIMWLWVRGPVCVFLSLWQLPWSATHPEFLATLLGTWVRLTIYDRVFLPSSPPTLPLRRRPLFQQRHATSRRQPSGRVLGPARAPRPGLRVRPGPRRKHTACGRSWWQVLRCTAHVPQTLSRGIDTCVVVVDDIEDAARGTHGRTTASRGG